VIKTREVQCCVLGVLGRIWRASVLKTHEVQCCVLGVHGR